MAAVLALSFSTSQFPQRVRRSAPLPLLLLLCPACGTQTEADPSVTESDSNILTFDHVDCVTASECPGGPPQLEPLQLLLNVNEALSKTSLGTIVTYAVDTTTADELVLRHTDGWGTWTSIRIGLASDGKLKRADVRGEGTHRRLDGDYYVNKDVRATGSLSDDVIPPTVSLTGGHYPWDAIEISAQEIIAREQLENLTLNFDAGGQRVETLVGDWKREFTGTADKLYLTHAHGTTSSELTWREMAGGTITLSGNDFEDLAGNSTDVTGTISVADVPDAGAGLEFDTLDFPVIGDVHAPTPGGAADSFCAGITCAVMECEAGIVAFVGESSAASAQQIEYRFRQVGDSSHPEHGQFGLSVQPLRRDPDAGRGNRTVSGDPLQEWVVGNVDIPSGDSSEVAFVISLGYCEPGNHIVLDWVRVK